LRDQSYSSYLIDLGSNLKDLITFQDRLSASKKGSIEIRLDSITGSLIGRCEFDSAEIKNSYVSKECKVTKPIGVKHVFLIYKIDVEKKGNISFLNKNWIKFKE